MLKGAGEVDLSRFNLRRWRGRTNLPLVGLDHLVCKLRMNYDCSSISRGQPRSIPTEGGDSRNQASGVVGLRPHREELGPSSFPSGGLVEVALPNDNRRRRLKEPSLLGQ
jgi:hypothetical protein